MFFMFDKDLNLDQFNKLKEIRMEKYIGTKILHAKPMNLGEYNAYRGWVMPEDENPNDKGYLVKYSDNYESWSPEGQFVESYRRVFGMNFGLAIEALKKGLRVCRAGWNGKGMWLMLANGTGGEVVTMSPLSDYACVGLDEVCIDPHIDMYTAKGTMQPGWLASQADMLADDWMIVE